LINESTRNAKDVLEGAESKARSILSGAEARGRKYISAAETEAQDVISEANREAESLIDSKRREAVALASAARREGERIVADAANEVIEYRRWLAEVISESERLYRVQSQALVAAEQAIAQSRQRLDGAFARLANMQAVVNDSLNEDGTVRHKEPVRVESRRRAPALDAPARGTSVKSEAKNSPARKSAVKKTSSKRK
jgi:vacuolar-type H+-ATPase subunit H